MKNYHIIVSSHDNGEDDKNDCLTFSEALQWVRLYLSDGWEKARIVRRYTENSMGVVVGSFERFADGETLCMVSGRYTALL